MKRLAGSLLLVAATAGFAMAQVNVGVDVNTPNVRVQVGTPPPSHVTIVERERVIVRDVERKDNGKHKGHYKKHKKHKKHHRND